MVKKLKTYKELAKESFGTFEGGVSMESLVGKKIIVTGAEEQEGEYGKFYSMTITLGKKNLSVACSSQAIIKILEVGKFPFTATVMKLKSKKRKNAFYYAFS